MQTGPGRNQGPGGGDINDLIRNNVPPGEDASVWDPRNPHGLPEHTDVDLWKRDPQGRVHHGDDRMHIPTDPSQRPW